MRGLLLGVYCLYYGHAAFQTFVDWAESTARLHGTKGQTANEAEGNTCVLRDRPLKKTTDLDDVENLPQNQSVLFEVKLHERKLEKFL